MSYLPLSTVEMFLGYFEKKIEKYSVAKYTHDKFITVYSINDTLLLWVELIGTPADPCLNAEEMYGNDRDNPYLEFPVKGKMYYTMNIAELTPNNIGFRYNNAQFVCEMSEITQIPYLDLYITFSKFGSKRESNNDCPNLLLPKSLFEKATMLFPELKIAERIDSWDGQDYNFIVFEFETAEGHIERAVAYTLQRPHTYVLQKCKEWITTGRLKGTAIINGVVERAMQSAFNSWKGMKRQKRLQQYLKYFYVTRRLKDKFDAYGIAVEIYNDANNGKYSNEERSTYSRPINKWVSEERVYTLTKALYKDCAVVYQHRPFFLRSPFGGQMSYDVFISKLNVAIEYQGKQHFEPVDFFGGKESFEQLQIRDQEKAKLSKENGIKLVYINYWEDISESLIIDRVGVIPKQKE